MSQVDRKLVKAMLDMLSNKFPARLKRIILLEPPGFFNFAFRIIRPLIPQKYLEKIAVARFGELPNLIDRNLLLIDFGGTLQFDPISFIDSLWLEEYSQLQPFPQVYATNLPSNVNITNQDTFVKNVQPEYSATEGAASL